MQSPCAAQTPAGSGRGPRSLAPLGVRDVGRLATALGHADDGRTEQRGGGREGKKEGLEAHGRRPYPMLTLSLPCAA